MISNFTQNSVGAIYFSDEIMLANIFLSRIYLFLFVRLIFLEGEKTGEMPICKIPEFEGTERQESLTGLFVPISGPHSSKQCQLFSKE